MPYLFQFKFQSISAASNFKEKELDEAIFRSRMHTEDVKERLISCLRESIGVGNELKDFHSSRKFTR